MDCNCCWDSYILKYVTEVNNSSHIKWRCLTKEFSFQHSKMANAIPVRYEHCTWTQWVVSAHYIQRDGQRQLRPRAVNRSRQRSSKHNHMLLDYTCRTVATKERSLKHRIWILIGLNFLSILGLPWWLSDKESVCQCRRQGFNPWSDRIPHAAE